MSTMLSAAGRRLPKQNSLDITHATDFVVMESSGFDDHEKTSRQPSAVCPVSMITLVVAGVVVACAMVTEAMIAATKQGSLPCSLRDYERLEVLAGHPPVSTCADS